VSAVDLESQQALLAAVQALAPRLAGWADQIEQERRLPPPLVDALIEAGLFRMLLPRSLNGGEVAPATFASVIEAVAKIDASTAWCLSQASGCSMAAAYLEPAVAWRIFGDRRAVLAWGPGADSHAVAVPGGYRVTGRWSFASGCHHATWLGGSCQIVEPDGRRRTRPDGTPDSRTMLFPATAAEIIDIWQVSGLCGTGSDAFAVADLFVPAEHSIARDEAAERREPGPLYLFMHNNLYAAGFASVALGIGRATLDAVVELAQAKTPRGFRGLLRDSAVIQSQVAECEARLRSARAFLHTTLHDVWAAVTASGQLTLEQRVLIRLAATAAIHQAARVVDTTFHAAGATAIFTSNPFERRFRDMHAVTQQVQGRQDHYETVGRFLLGLEPDQGFL
jgi:alkylation response protein AidB-like acyl-CoA dehydrogenase